MPEKATPSPLAPVYVYAFNSAAEQLLLTPALLALNEKGLLARIYTNRMGQELWMATPLEAKCHVPSRALRGLALKIALRRKGLHAFNHRPGEFPKLARSTPGSVFLEKTEPALDVFAAREKLFSLAGLGPVSPACWSFEPREDETLRCAKYLSQHLNPVVVLVGTHPERPLGAWSANTLGKIVGNIAGARQENVVLLGGQDCGPLAAKAIDLARADKSRCLNLCGALPLRETAAIMAQCRCVVSGDGVLLPLALALKKPTLVFAHPASEIRLQMPPIVHACTHTATLPLEDTFDACPWDRYLRHLGAFLDCCHDTPSAVTHGIL